MPAWWRRAVHWLAQPGSESHFDIHAEKPVVARGERMSFAARVTDDAYRPVPDVSVRVTVRPERRTAAPLDSAAAAPREVELAGGEGFYRGSLEELPPGRYRYSGEARAGGRVIGTAEGAVAVDSLGAEMERLEADHELLERMAAASGGRLWHPDSLGSLSETLESSARNEAERVQVALWDHPALFVLFVLAASLEWFLRRRRGLI
jgi:hypothetical protein